MRPPLHDSYSREQALKAFSDQAHYEEMCDGQFIILPKVILCFATIENSADESHFCSPSTFIWKPQRLDYDLSDQRLPWLPLAVRDVWHPESRKRLKEHHLFVKASNDESFLYAGAAHLGSYGGNLNKGDVKASFSLTEKLPRNAWLRFGGYSGWLVEVDHTTHYVKTNDAASFEKLVHQLVQQEFSHLTMTRYEEDSLSVYSNNSRRSWLMYLREPSDSGLYVNNPRSNDIEASSQRFECACGISLEFPVEQTVSSDEAVQIAREFFDTGELPNIVSWELG